MNRNRLQTTIRNPVTVNGRGYWNGREVEIRFQPAEENHGISFVRTDLAGRPRIQANVLNRVKGPRRTTLVTGGTCVEMVEHVMAALAGLQIDNCEILVNQAEMPGCDGSSKQFVDALQSAGIRQQTSPKTVWSIRDVIRVGNDHSWIQCEPSPTGQLELCYQLNYWQPAIGKQEFSCVVTPERFVADIADARTFVLQSEANLLRQQGLGLHVTYDEILVFDDTFGPIGNEMRYSNECARHKLLDMIGDFAL
ncbi:MAG: UDP-3-O-acyl-N-acetylglucosamine deacetylase, partial [Planctomycetota bacterium]